MIPKEGCFSQGNQHLFGCPLKESVPFSVQTDVSILTVSKTPHIHAQLHLLSLIGAVSSNCLSFRDTDLDHVYFTSHKVRLILFIRFNESNGKAP